MAVAVAVALLTHLTSIFSISKLAASVADGTAEVAVADGAAEVAVADGAAEVVLMCWWGCGGLE